MGSWLGHRPQVTDVDRSHARKMKKVFMIMIFSKEQRHPSIVRRVCASARAASALHGHTGRAKEVAGLVRSAAQPLGVPCRIVAGYALCTHIELRQAEALCASSAAPPPVTLHLVVYVLCSRRALHY